jgi:hypothetical protein
MAEVILHPNTHGQWYEKLSTRKQSKLAKSVIAITEKVLNDLSLSIQLPEKVILGFSSGDQLASFMPPRAIWFTRKGIGLFEDSKGSFLGLVAHEASHMSDSKSGNDCDRNYGHCTLSTVVSEGKAELVGYEVGGSDYDCLLDELEKAEKTTAYTALLSEGKLKKAIVNDFGHEALGFSAVSDVVDQFNVQIFDIHHESVDFYRQALRSVVGNLSDGVQ